MAVTVGSSTNCILYKVVNTGPQLESLDSSTNDVSIPDVLGFQMFVAGLDTKV